MNVYEKNIRFLQKEYPYIEIGSLEEQSERVFWEQSLVGEEILGFYKNGQKYYLNSQYEAELWAKQWVEQFEMVTYRTKFVVLGIGNGMYLRALHEKYPENMIIFCEIYSDIERDVLKHLDFTEWLQPNMYPVMGIRRMKVFEDYLENMISYSNYKDVVFCSTPNYELIDLEVYTAFRTVYFNRVERLVVKRNTLIADEQMRRESFLNNLFRFPRENVLGQLVQNMEGIDLSGRTAIVVSAGPSLDKNVHLLKQAKNKALLIAVDAAAKPMLHAGVCPDIITTIDPLKDESILQKEELLNCPMVASIYSHYKLIRQHRGRIYFPTSEMEYTQRIYRKYNKEMYSLESGGSVANNAFSLAELLGFQTIILVGQDLAYPNGKVHASDAVYQNCQDNDIDANNKKKYFEVEANDGSLILTEANMNMYRKWFEYKAGLGEVRIINATEGGAKIKGTEIMTLQNALDETCFGKTDIDFANLMRKNEKAFSLKEQEEIETYYIQLENILEQWEVKLEAGIQKYARMKTLYKLGKYATEEFKKLVQETGNLTNELNRSDEVYLMNQWGNKQEYEVLDTLAGGKDSEGDEVLLLIEGGIKMYRSYVENCRELRAKWSELLNEYQLK